MGSSRRTALVTGAARRIGAAIAEALGQDGWNVLLHYNTSEGEAQALCERLQAQGISCATVQANLAEPAEIQALVGRAQLPFGPLGLLVNNASVFRYDRADTITEENWRHISTVNLEAPIFLAQAFAAQAQPGEDAVVINMLDQKVENLNPDFFSYTVSKFGLLGATRVLAMALAPHIRVCGISPGVTMISGKQTPDSFLKSTTVTPLGRSSTVEDIIEAIRFILKSRALTGSTITIDGGEQLMRRRRDVAFDIE